MVFLAPASVRLRHNRLDNEAVRSLFFLLDGRVWFLFRLRLVLAGLIAFGRRGLQAGLRSALCLAVRALPSAMRLPNGSVAPEDGMANVAP